MNAFYSALDKSLDEAVARIRIAPSNSKTATVEPYGFPMLCVFDWEPEEPRTNDHPGSPATAVLEHCYVGGVDIFNMLDSDQTDRIEQALETALCSTT